MSANQFTARKGAAPVPLLNIPTNTGNKVQDRQHPPPHRSDSEHRNISPAQSPSLHRAPSVVRTADNSQSEPVDTYIKSENATKETRAEEAATMSGKSIHVTSKNPILSNSALPAPLLVWVAPMKLPTQIERQRASDGTELSGGHHRRFRVLDGVREEDALKLTFYPNHNDEIRNSRKQKQGSVKRKRGKEIDKAEEVGEGGGATMVTVKELADKVRGLFPPLPAPLEYKVVNPFSQAYHDAFAVLPCKEKKEETIGDGGAESSTMYEQHNTDDDGPELYLPQNLLLSQQWWKRQCRRKAKRLQQQVGQLNGGEKNSSNNFPHNNEEENDDESSVIFLPIHIHRAGDASTSRLNSSMVHTSEINRTRVISGEETVPHGCHTAHTETRRPPPIDTNTAESSSETAHTMGGDVGSVRVPPAQLLPSASQTATPTPTSSCSRSSVGAERLPFAAVPFITGTVANMMQKEGGGLRSRLSFAMQTEALRLRGHGTHGLSHRQTPRQVHHLPKFKNETTTAQQQSHLHTMRARTATLEVDRRSRESHSHSQGPSRAQQTRSVHRSKSAAQSLTQLPQIFKHQQHHYTSTTPSNSRPLGHHRQLHRSHDNNDHHHHIIKSHNTTPLSSAQPVQTPVSTKYDVGSMNSSISEEPAYRRYRARILHIYQQYCPEGIPWMFYQPVPCGSNTPGQSGLGAVNSSNNTSNNSNGVHHNSQMMHRPTPTKPHYPAGTTTTRIDKLLMSSRYRGREEELIQNILDKYYYATRFPQARSNSRRPSLASGSARRTANNHHHSMENLDNPRGRHATPRMTGQTHFHHPLHNQWSENENDHFHHNNNYHNHHRNPHEGALSSSYSPTQAHHISQVQHVHHQQKKKKRHKKQLITPVVTATCESESSSGAEGLVAPPAVLSTRICSGTQTEVTERHTHDEDTESASMPSSYRNNRKLKTAVTTTMDSRQQSCDANAPSAPDQPIIVDQQTNTSPMSCLSHLIVSPIPHPSSRHEKSTVDGTTADTRRTNSGQQTAVSAGQRDRSRSRGKDDGGFDRRSEGVYRQDEEAQLLPRPDGGLCPPMTPSHTHIHTTDAVINTADGGDGAKVDDRDFLLSLLLPPPPMEAAPQDGKAAEMQKNDMCARRSGQPPMQPSYPADIIDHYAALSTMLYNQMARLYAEESASRVGGILGAEFVARSRLLADCYQGIEALEATDRGGEHPRTVQLSAEKAKRNVSKDRSRRKNHEREKEREKNERARNNSKKRRATQEISADQQIDIEGAIQNVFHAYYPPEHSQSVAALASNMVNYHEYAHSKEGQDNRLNSNAAVSLLLSLLAPPPALLLPQPTAHDENGPNDFDGYLDMETEKEAAMRKVFLRYYGGAGGEKCNVPSADIGANSPRKSAKSSIGSIAQTSSSNYTRLESTKKTGAEALVRNRRNSDQSGGRTENYKKIPRATTENKKNRVNKTPPAAAVFPDHDHHRHVKVRQLSVIATPDAREGSECHQNELKPLEQGSAPLSQRHRTSSASWENACAPTKTPLSALNREAGADVLIDGGCCSSPYDIEGTTKGDDNHPCDQKRTTLSFTEALGKTMPMVEPPIREQTPAAQNTLGVSSALPGLEDDLTPITRASMQDQATDTAPADEDESLMRIRAVAKQKAEAEFDAWMRESAGGNLA